MKAELQYASRNPSCSTIQVIEGCSIIGLISDVDLFALFTDRQMQLWEKGVYTFNLPTIALRHCMQSYK